MGKNREEKISDVIAWKRTTPSPGGRVSAEQADGRGTAAEQRSGYAYTFQKIISYRPHSSSASLKLGTFPPGEGIKQKAVFE